MKVSELEQDTTYVICPEPSCKLFWNTNCMCPCDGSCPYQDRERFVIQCHNCKEMIILPGNHSWMQHIPHNCPNGDHPLNFRSGSTHYLLYELPVI